MNKLICADINAINETSEQLIKQVLEYRENEIDGFYIYDFSKDGDVRDEFIKKLRNIKNACPVSFATGITASRFEDIKKAYYTGADCVFLHLQTDPEVIMAGVARFGSDKVGVELDYSKEECSKEVFEKLKKLGVVHIMIKHVDKSKAFFDRLANTDLKVFIRDSLMRNDLTTLLEHDAVLGVATTHYKGKNVRNVKDVLISSGIDVKNRRSEIPFEEFKTDEKGLVPCITQDDETGEVLMLAYMNKEAYNRTVATGKMTYFSRSRNELWVKGATSGHYQYVRNLSIDCDKDTILAKVHQVGAACHTGNHSCFFTDLAGFDKSGKKNDTLQVFKDVYATITDRREHPKEGSYTNYLFNKGIDKILKKCGEESTEIVIAAKNPDRTELRYEIADYLYHLMVLMVESGLTWDDICEELADRE